MASPLSPQPLNTKNTTPAGEPSYSTTGNNDRQVAYDIGFALIALLIVIILIYTYYMCNGIKGSRPPATTSDSDTDDLHSIVLATGLEEDTLSNFPTFVYSDAKKPRKLDNETEIDEVGVDSGCHICLADYGSMDVLRLLPECEHLFHMSCIDTWLKVRSTCPVCRNSPLPTSSELTLNSSEQ